MFLPWNIPAQALSLRVCSVLGKQSMLNNQHILTGIIGLCTPAAQPVETYFRMSQAHTHTVFKPIFLLRHNYKSVTLIHTDLVLKRGCIQNRWRVKKKKKTHTSPSFIFAQNWHNCKSTSHLNGARSRPKPHHSGKEGMEQDMQGVPLLYRGQGTIFNYLFECSNKEMLT